MLLNVGFALGHPDSDVIGPVRVIIRFVCGLAFLIPAVWLYSLFACFVLHALWNLSVTIRRWNHDSRDRIMVWTEGPLEILTQPGAKPSMTIRRIFRNTQTVRANPH